MSDDPSLRLLEAVERAGDAAAAMPHIVVYSDPPRHVVTCTGPYDSAFDAFLAAEHEAAELGEDSARYTIAPLLDAVLT